jgi:hypothetical protein
MGIAIAIVSASRSGGISGPSRGPGAGGVVSAGERLQWASGRGSVVVMDIATTGSRTSWGAIGSSI